jgi:hypothetical protein
MPDGMRFPAMEISRHILISRYFDISVVAALIVCAGQPEKRDRG